MEQMIQDLLAYARVDRGRPRAVAVDLRSLFRKVLGELPAAANTSIVLEALPTLRVDPLQMERLASNLLSNAVKYRGTHIRVSAKLQGEGEGDHWLFAVEDDGVGIEAEALQRVFGLFERAAPTAYPGTGLGLAICKRIVENHGGRIWAESELGHGTTVFFILPAVISDQDLRH